MPKCWMEVTSITKRQKSLSSKVKSEDNACVFLRQQGNYSPRVCPWGTNCHWKFLFECLWKRIRRVRPEYSAPGSWFLLHDNAPVHRAVAVQEFLARKQVCMLNHHPTPLIYPPVIIFCSPNWSYHWKGASLKMFNTSKELWHRVFGPYHKKTCRGHSSLC